MGSELPETNDSVDLETLSETAVSNNGHHEEAPVVGETTHPGTVSDIASVGPVGADNTTPDTCNGGASVVATTTTPASDTVGGTSSYGPIQTSGLTDGSAATECGYVGSWLHEIAEKCLSSKYIRFSGESRCIHRHQGDTGSP